MTDYEHFRPYLHSHDLGFSYGVTKGRHHDRWQREAEQLGPAVMVQLLENYGFSALLINRQGYGDRAEWLLKELRGIGKSRVLARTNDIICIALNPTRHTIFPPVFAQGWHDLEGTYDFNRRWSSGDATLILQNSSDQVKAARLRFGLAAINPRRVEISADGRQLYSAFLDTKEQWVTLTVALKPGRNDLVFTSDEPGEFPRNGDPRKLSFHLLNFELEG
jgi:hypothetical protein